MDVVQDAYFAANKWMHICMAWSNTDGKVNIYADGKSIHEAVVNAGKSIPAGGSLVLFQVKSLFSSFISG